MTEVGTLKELNVQPGDVVECDYTDCQRWTVGRLYEVDHDKAIIDNYGDRLCFASGAKFRILSRATDIPKTWGEMTDAEKGALLLAAHEGKVIELFSGFEWDEVELPSFYSHMQYRVRTEPKRETVELHYGWTNSAFPTRSDHDTHRITFDTINGEPDCASIKMERLK